MIGHGYAQMCISMHSKNALIPVDAADERKAGTSAVLAAWQAGRLGGAQVTAQPHVARSSPWFRQAALMS
jgi:hypothetical protein